MTTPDFGISGPDFLGLYVGMLIVLMIGAGIARHMLRTPADHPGQIPLDPFQTAYLSGGDQAATHAAIVALTSRMILTFDPRGRFFVGPSQPTSWLHPLEQAVYAGVAGDRTGRGATVTSLTGVARPALLQLRSQLQQMGLVPVPAQSFLVRVVPAVIVLAAEMVGGVRLVLGVFGGRPVGYLIGLMILTAIIALFFLAHSVRRTRRGDHALGALRRAYSGLRYSTATANANLGGEDLGLAVGLFGVAALAGGPLDPLVHVLDTSSSSSSGDGGSGGSSDGGGGSSCGGGCGGGCGG
jgi:uncharacterized protein (TIGR04222 family)